jgi:hypothetical protein
MGAVQHRQAETALPQESPLAIHRSASQADHPSQGRRVGGLEALPAARLDLAEAFEEPLQKQGIAARPWPQDRFQLRVVVREALAALGQGAQVEA